MAKPTNQQVKAVQAVLYRKSRMNAIRDHLSSIDVLMNADPSVTLPPNDSRVDAGSGPNWYVPSTGAIDPSVSEAADRCDKLARLYQSMHNELGQVNFPQADKAHLLTSLSELATAWHMRGAAWRAPTPPANPKQVADAIAAHHTASVKASAKAKRYLRPPPNSGA